MDQFPYLLNLENYKEYCSCGNLANCERELAHKSYDDGLVFGLFQIFKILTCPACESVSVVMYTASEIFEDFISKDEAQNRTLNRAYSRKVLYFPPRQIHSSIPDPIAEIFSQAEAVTFSSPRACFILCRAVLEEICNDFGIPKNGRNSKLHFRLIELFDKTNISGDLRKVLISIKELGNLGAHPDRSAFSDDVKVKDAEVLTVIVGYVLERLYVDKYRQDEATRKLSELNHLLKDPIL